MNKTNDYNEYNVKVCSKKIFTLPNILSMLRIALIPVMAILYFYEYYIWAAVILVVSAITDVIDGVIARKFNIVTELGKALDPIADKLTQAVVLVCLAINFKQLWLPLGILVIKEVFTGITQVIIYQKIKIVVGADWYGKITTVFLYLLLFTHIIWGFWGGIPPFASWILIGVSIALMISSLVLYAIRNIKIIKKSKEQSQENE